MNHVKPGLRVVRSHSFTPEEFDAPCNGKDDDSKGLQRAIDEAANVARSSFARAPFGEVGVAVDLPPIMRIKAPVDRKEGVVLVGAGHYATTRILVDSLGRTVDAFTTGPESGRYSLGGGFVNVDIVTPNGFDDCRDIIHMDTVTSAVLDNVRAWGGGRYGIFSKDPIHLHMNDVDALGAWVSPLYIDSTAPATTVRTFNSYFRYGYTGPNADVAGLGLLFDGTTFESAGADAASRADASAKLNLVGFRQRSGTSTLDTCYFENNAWHDMEFGTEVSGDQYAYQVDNPIFRTGDYTLPGKAALYGERISSLNVSGGDWIGMPRSIVFAGTVLGIVDIAIGRANDPEYLKEGKTVHDIPGRVQWAANGSEGIPIVTGKIARYGDWRWTR